MKRWMVGLGLLVVLGAIALVGLVFVTAPGSRKWEPRTPEGRELYGLARRDVWPSDVRAAPEKYRDAVVVWSGLVREHRVSADQQRLRTVIEHHYWDFIEDKGAQSAN